MKIVIQFCDGWKVQNETILGDDGYTFEGKVNGNIPVYGKIYNYFSDLIYFGSFTKDGFYEKGKLMYYDTKSKCCKYKLRDFFEGHYHPGSCLPSLGFLKYKHGNTFFGDFDKDGNSYRGMLTYYSHPGYRAFGGILSSDGNPIKGVFEFKDGNVFKGILHENKKRILYDEGILYLKKHKEIRFIEGKFKNNEMLDGKVVNKLGFERQVQNGILSNEYNYGEMKLSESQNKLVNKFYKIQRIYIKK